MIISDIFLIIVIITLFDIGMNDYSLMIIWRRNYDDCEGDAQNANVYSKHISSVPHRVKVIPHRVEVIWAMPNRKAFLNGFSEITN